MRILQVTNSFKYAWSSGGVVRVAYDTSLELTKKGHKVTVFTTDRALSKSYVFKKNQPFELDGIVVYYFKNLSTSLANIGITIPYYSPFIIPRKLKEFDVIHIHEPKRIINVLIYHYAKKHSIPYVFQAHGSLPQSVGLKKQFLNRVFNILFTRRLLRDASKVIALSEIEAEQYKCAGVPAEKIAKVPNGIDLTEYSDLPSKGSFKKKFNIQENMKIILYLGRLHKAKGIDFLIKAYAHMIKTMKCDNTLLVIAGPDDGYLIYAKQIVTTLKVNDKVVFIGMLSEEDKKCAFVDSDIVVNVEPKNVYGLVPLEAAACAVPVIVSTGNAISDIVNEGKFGFSVQYGALNELACTLLKFISNNSIRADMGKRGREFVFKNYGWSINVDKLEKVYEQITGA